MTHGSPLFCAISIAELFTRRGMLRFRGLVEPSTHMAGPQCWELEAAGFIETTRAMDRCQLTTCTIHGTAPLRRTELQRISHHWLSTLTFILQPCQSICFHSPGASANMPSNGQSAVPPASFPAWYFAACLVHTAGWPGTVAAVSWGPAPRPPFG